MKRLLLLCVVLNVWLAGCGVGSTDGTLTLSPVVSTDKTGGTYNISASATYVPPAGSVPNGARISFSWSATPAGSSTSVPGSATTTLGADGIGTVSFDVNQTTVPIYVTVTATIGDLSQNSQVTIPPVTTFSATPAVLTFPQASPAGTSLTITLAGTYTPYSATSSSSDINVGVNGNTVTVIKISTTGTIQKNASVTLSDSKGTVIQVPVSYY